MKYSLVIPCYNESRNLPLLLERCRLLALQQDIEVIIVDNGSTDRTPEVLDEILQNFPGCRSIRVPVNQGYGHGILEGLRSSKGEVIGWTHADLQTDPVDVLEAIKLFEIHGPEVFVKGRRYGRPLSDVIFTIGMSVFETCLLQKSLWDINAQPTMFSKRLFETWAIPPTDFALDLYAYYESKQARLPIYRFNVRFGERAHGVSHWNVDWKSKLKFIRRTIEFSLELRKKLKP